MKNIVSATMVENATVEKVAMLEIDLWNGKRKPFQYASQDAKRVYKRFPNLKLSPEEAAAVAKSKVPRMALAGQATLSPEKKCFLIGGMYFTRVDFELYSVVDMKGKMPSEWACEFFKEPQFCGIAV